MINNGLVEEVKNFYDKKIKTKPLINGIGYKELYKYFDNEMMKNFSVMLETKFAEKKENIIFI